VLDLLGVSHVERAHLHAKRRRHSLDDAELGVPGRIGSVAKDSHACRAWRDLLEQLQPFPAQTVFEQQKAGGVAAWPGQAINEAAADRIDSSREHDWHGAACLLQCAHGCSGRGQDHVGHERNQFRRVSANVVGIVRAPTIVDPHVAADGPAQFPEPLQERRIAGLCFRLVRSDGGKHADPPHPLALLRARRERPRYCRAAVKCDEFPTPHGAYPKAKDHGRSIAVLAVGQWRASQIKSGASARRALGHRQMLRGLSLTQRSCGPDRAARPCRLLGTSRRIRKKNVMECLVGAVSHSGLMLAVRITLLHFSVSLTMKVSKSAEEPANMALPRSERRACTWGSARIALISLLTLATIAPALLLLRLMAHHGLASEPGPKAPAGGRSGNASKRMAVVTAKARSRPDLICSIDGGRPMNITCTCPPSRSVIAGAAPRYGTCVML